MIYLKSTVFNMMKEPSYEVRTSKKYHDLFDKLCEKHCIKDGNLWKLPRERIKDVPKDELDVMFRYSPITEIVIHPKKAEMKP